MEVGGIAEDEVDAQADRDSLSMERVFDERLNFRRLEELLEGVA